MLVSLDIPRLIADIRTLSDQRGGNYVSDEEIVRIMQSAYDWIYFTLVEKDENYFLEEIEVESDRQAYIRLPENIYKIKLLRIQFNEDDFSYIVTPRKLNEILAGDYQDYNFTTQYAESSDYTYIHLKDRIRIFPPNIGANKTFNLFYIPDPPQLLDTFRGEAEALLPRGFENYIKYYAPVDILISENLDATTLQGIRDKWGTMIMEWSQSRRLDFPQQITKEKRLRRGLPWG